MFHSQHTHSHTPLSTGSRGGGAVARAQDANVMPISALNPYSNRWTIKVSPCTCEHTLQHTAPSTTPQATTIITLSGSYHQQG